jgi:hypothetical protein
MSYEKLVSSDIHIEVLISQSYNIDIVMQLYQFDRNYVQF